MLPQFLKVETLIVAITIDPLLSYQTLLKFSKPLFIVRTSKRVQVLGVTIHERGEQELDFVFVIFFIKIICCCYKV